MKNAFAVVLFLTACSTTGKVSQDEKLDVEIVETEHALDIVAMTADGAEAGRVHVQTGRFTMEMEDQRTVDGRQMEITIDGKSVRHESEGYGALTLPPIVSDGYQNFNDFLRDQRVRDALGRWGIGFEEAVTAPAFPLPAALTETAPAESPSFACTYATCSSSTTLNCQENTQWHKVDGSCAFEAAMEYVCCTGTAAQKKAAQRRCGYAPDINPCGSEGTNGCAVCWTNSWTTSCTTSSSGSSSLKCIDDGGSIFMSSPIISISYL